MASVEPVSLEDEYELTVEQSAGEPLSIVDHYPDDGGVGIGSQVEPYFFLNRPLTEDEQEGLGSLRLIDLLGLGDTVASYDLDFDAQGVQFTGAELRRDRTYWMGFDPANHDGVEGRFETSAPGGAAFDISTGLVVEQLGQGGDWGDLLEAWFQQPSRPVWVMEALFAPEGGADVDLVVAPGRFDPHAELPFDLRRDFGYIGSFEGIELAEDGWFDHEQPGVFLPIWASDRGVLLRVDGVRLTGRLVDEGADLQLRDLRLEGFLSTRWLLRLAQEGDAWQQLVSSIEPDLDTNGNGVPDSASIALSLSAQPIDPAGIDPS